MRVTAILPVTFDTEDVGISIDPTSLDDGDYVERMQARIKDVARDAMCQFPTIQGLFRVTDLVIHEAEDHRLIE